MRRLLAALVGVAALAAAAWLIHDARRVPPRPTSSSASPLTDMAPRPTAQPVLPSSTPSSVAVSVVPRAAPLAPVAPSLMPDPQHPPQWTQPLARPTPPVPPDPNVPPPMAVDPQAIRPHG